MDLSFNISIVYNLAHNKNKLYETLDYWFRYMLNLDFLKKSLGIVSPPDFACDFSRKILFMQNSIDWPNFITSFPLLLEILFNMCIAIVCQPGSDVINFEINLIFLIKSFFDMAKTSRQKFLRWNKKQFSSFLKSFPLPNIVSDLRVCS